MQTRNLAFLSVIGLQSLSMIDGLTTALGLQFSGAFETNPFYFGLLTAKILGLCLLAFILLNRKLPQKINMAILAFSLTLGVLWISVIANNLQVIGALI